MVDLFQCLITCNCLADLSYLDTKTAFFITLRVMTVKNVNRPIFKQLYNSRPIYPFITQFNGIDSIPLAFHWVRTIIDAAVILMWYQGSPLWRHQMETFSALLALCAGISPFTGEFPSQSTVTRSFDVFFDLRLDIRLNKHSWGWWFEMPSCTLWRHSNMEQIFCPKAACTNCFPFMLFCLKWRYELIPCFYALLGKME